MNMSRIDSITRHRVSVRHFPGHYWNGEWCAPSTVVTGGYLDPEFWVRGERRGDDLYVFMGTHLVELDPEIIDHESAVSWAERQFEVTQA
jgi:hypothetical protein